jgi:hypothetical protein
MTTSEQETIDIGTIDSVVRAMIEKIENTVEDE